MPDRDSKDWLKAPLPYSGRGAGPGRTTHKLLYGTFLVHRSHSFVSDGDDNMECMICMARPYNDAAQKPCNEDRGHGGPE